MKCHGLGVGNLAEIGYRAMLARSRWQPEDLARVLAWPNERVTAVLAELRAEWLAMNSSVEAGAMRAIQPCLALPTLAARRLGGGQMPGAVAVETFIALHEQTAGRLDGGTQLSDMDEVMAVVERLAATVRTEMIVLAPAYEPGSPEFAKHVAEGVLRRGSGLRALWRDDIAASNNFAAWLSDRGVGPRALSVVPVRALVVDGLVGVVLDDSATWRVVRDEAELGSLIALVDRLWTESVEVNEVPDAGLARSRYELVLRLLAQGLTDGAIARRLGVSVRTVRTDVASAMIELDARSRFQAGARAVQMGLL
jgi:hypothetical protein